MDVREKLKQVYREASDYAREAYGKRNHISDCCFATADDVIDYLISNGVTITPAVPGPEIAEMKWIPVTERLPEEKESMFERWYGTDRWLPGMFRMASDEVIVATVYNDGSSKVQAMRTLDGEWSDCRVFKNLKVTHWMPLPEPPKELAMLEGL